MFGLHSFKIKMEFDFEKQVKILIPFLVNKNVVSTLKLISPMIDNYLIAQYTLFYFTVQTVLFWILRLSSEF